MAANPHLCGGSFALLALCLVCTQVFFTGAAMSGNSVIFLNQSSDTSTTPSVNAVTVPSYTGVAYSFPLLVLAMAWSRLKS